MQRCSGAEVFLALPEIGRLIVVPVNPQENVSHPPVLVGGEEILHGRAFMTVGQAFLRPGLRILGFRDPGFFPALQITGLYFAADAGDLEDIATAFTGFGDEAEGLRAHTLGRKEKIEHTCGPPDANNLIITLLIL